jgi:hypothetical protein
MVGPSFLPASTGYRSAEGLSVISVLIPAASALQDQALHLKPEEC